VTGVVGCKVTPPRAVHARRRKLRKRSDTTSIASIRGHTDDQMLREIDVLVDP